MSQQATPERRADIKIAVRNRSQYAKQTLHRPDDGADDPLPACAEGDYREDADFKEFDIVAYPTWSLCNNPECFGERWW